jgi:endoglucanase
MISGIGVLLKCGINPARDSSGKPEARWHCVMAGLGADSPTRGTRGPPKFGFPDEASELAPIFIGNNKDLFHPMIRNFFLISLVCASITFCHAQETLVINNQEYLEMTGLNVILTHGLYREDYPGGVGIIQHGSRVATNGDLRLEPAPGQGQTVANVGERIVDLKKREISVRMEFSDPGKKRKETTPGVPDSTFAYTLKIKPEGRSFRIIVDLDEPLPDDWVGRVGFNLELLPGMLVGKSYYMDTVFGVFTQQAGSPLYKDARGEMQVLPMAEGKMLIVAPESDRQRMMIENINSGKLQLIDGRGKHNDGSFVVRSLVGKGETRNAIEWVVTPYTIRDWMHEPVIQVSKAGYHPRQQKIANIEVDVKDTRKMTASLIRIMGNGGIKTALQATPVEWGRFIRYKYLQLDFTAITAPGIYVVKYGSYQSEPFQIAEDVFKRNVWQPVLEYSLPVQMCHMRVNERSRVWHGLCHMDDARMAPSDSNHVEGVYRAGAHVPGLDQGGWHHAANFDLQINAQAETIHMLALAYEAFKPQYDNTTIDRENRIVEIQRPDGKNDFLQQIEHGVLPIIAGYQSLGQLYRGVRCPAGYRYAMLGDAANMTDNKIAEGSLKENTPPDDRWIDTEEDPERALETAAALAAAARTLKDFNPSLSAECLMVAQKLWTNTKEKEPMHRLSAAVELYQTTSVKTYGDWIVLQQKDIVAKIDQAGCIVAPVLTPLANKKFASDVRNAVQGYYNRVQEQQKRNPYRVPYKPNSWDGGWGMQRSGVNHYFFHTGFPDIFPNTYMLQALNFVLACRPGTNTASFASVAGAHASPATYGFDHIEGSYIPGSISSGPGTADFIFLVLAADHLLNKQETFNTAGY